MKKYYLMAPGPTPVPSNVLLAMAQPMIHHRTPEYEALFIEVRAGLKRLFQTSQDVIPFTSSGTGAMEAAVVNTLSSGDTVLVLRAGKFGQRWEEICATYGITVIPLEAPFGETVAPEAFARALREHPEAKAVLMQHSESSTGVLHDAKGIAAVTRSTGAILIVDAVSSLGIADLRMDEWGLDLVVSGSQKGLMLPPGLSFCALSDKAWGHVKASRLPKYYFDVATERKFVARNECRFTPAVSIFVGLREVLKMLEAEGLPAVFRRHERLARATRSGAEALGLELFARSAPSPALTAVVAPRGLDSEAVLSTYSTSHNITIAGGQDHLKGKIVRIAHIGYMSEFDIITAISGLEMTLSDLNFGIRPGAGVASAQATFAETRRA
jgi:aspartate aminotransferase-like enzyme